SHLAQDTESARGDSRKSLTMARLKEWLGPTTVRQCLSEILAGVVVCFAQIPESVAFANLANCPPAIGLQAAWIVGLVCALFGGRPGMINGSAGALAAVTKSFVSKEVDGAGVIHYTGLVQLFWSVVFASALILLGAASNVGKFLCLIPATVVIGFCNGLGWVIGHAQLAWFQDEQHTFLQGEVMRLSVVSCLVTFVIMQTLVSLRLKGVPAALIAILSACLLEFCLFRPVLGTETPTVRDKSPFDTRQTVPRLFFLNGDYDLAEWGSLSQIAVQGVTIAVVAMLESLLCLEVMNDLTRTVGQPNRQLWALGAGNLLAGLLGTMGGNSLIELCVMNVQSGGTLRLSSAICSVGLLLIFVVGFELLNFIPVSSLAGVMIAVVIGFVRWKSLPAVIAAFLPRSSLEPSPSGGSRGRLRDYLWSVRIGRYDALIIIIVTFLTAVYNLAVAVGIGVSLSSVRFAYQQTRPVEIQVTLSSGAKTYTLLGPIFFGARREVIEAFTPRADPPSVQIDFGSAEIFDFSIMQELHAILEQYAELGKSVRILNLADATHLPALLRFGAMPADSSGPNSISIIDAGSCVGDGCGAGGTVVSHAGSRCSGSVLSRPINQAGQPD
ncbi:unnamed protein product, partial [Prorocentrum cordatum]